MDIKYLLDVVAFNLESPWWEDCVSIIEWWSCLMSWILTTRYLQMEDIRTMNRLKVGPHFCLEILLQAKWRICWTSFWQHNLWSRFHPVHSIWQRRQKSKSKQRKIVALSLWQCLVQPLCFNCSLKTKSHSK